MLTLRSMGVAPTPDSEIGSSAPTLAAVIGAACGAAVGGRLTPKSMVGSGEGTTGVCAVVGCWAMAAETNVSARSGAIRRSRRMRMG